MRRRVVKGGSSGHGQDDLVVHLGLGEHAVLPELEVHWPSGEVTRVEDVAADRVVELVEPE